jgi:hypothetical protein
MSMSTVDCRFLFSLSKKLKGLFTLFAAHMIQQSAILLNQLNTSKTGRDEMFEQTMFIVYLVN